MRRNQVVFFLALLIAPVSCGWAGETAQFLKIGVGGRPVGMGNAFTAVADDINALAWNPAGLSLLSKKEIGFTHAQMFADITYDFMGYAHPTRIGIFGLGINYLTHAEIAGRDENRRTTGGFSASDMAVNFAYGKKLSHFMRVGTNVKFLQSRLADAGAETFAVDMGGLFNLSGVLPGRLPMTFGLAVQNIGPGMKLLDKTSQLPLTLAMGLGYNFPLGLTLAFDFKHHPYSRSNEFNLGTEYAVFSTLSLRMGYLASSVSSGLNGEGSGGHGGSDGLSSLGTGLGVRVSGYQIDYAFTPLGELGNTQRISLNARF